MAKRTKLLALRLQPVEHEALLAAAEQADVTVSEFVRTLAVREAARRLSTDADATRAAPLARPAR